MPRRLSAIIPTRDRPQLLQDCLRTLAGQDLAGVVLEVVVVDDGSEPPLSDLVDRAQLEGLDLRFVRQEAAGLNVARNAGAEAASSELLAFLDDDTLVDARWARAIVNAFDAGWDGVGGRILLRYEGPRPSWLRHPAHGYLSGFDYGSTARALDWGTKPFGANCAVTRTRFASVGGFRVGLDREGDSLISAGDTDFFTRVSERGGRLVYWPDAIVEHRVPTSRLTPAYFRRRGYAQGVSDGLLELSHGRVRQALRVGGWFGRIPLILAKGIVVERSAVGALIWWSYCRGRLAALLHGAGAAG